MKFGMNLLLWTDDLKDEMFPVLQQLKGMGYDGVEVPIFDLTVEKYAAWGKRLDDLGLERTAVTVRTAKDNPISPDKGVRTLGVENNKRVLECCQALGAHDAGRAVPLGPGRVLRPRPHGRRVEVGGREHAASGRPTPPMPA